MNIRIISKRYDYPFFFQAGFNERIADIYIRIRQKYSIDREFKLIFDGKQLDPNLTLSQNGLYDNCTYF